MINYSRLFGIFFGIVLFHSNAQSLENIVAVSKGNFVVTSKANILLKLWKLPPGERSIWWHREGPGILSIEKINIIDISPDESIISIINSSRKRVSILHIDKDTGKARKGTNPIKHIYTDKSGKAYPISLKFSSEGNSIYIYCSDGRFRKYDVKKGVLTTLSGKYPQPEGVMDIFDISRNSRFLTAIWTSSQPSGYGVILQDLKSNRRLKTKPLHDAPITSVAFSNDTMRVASASRDGTIIIWNRKSGKNLQE